MIGHGAATTSGELPPVPNEADGRVFPCESCGADLEFHIGNQSLTCPYCGFVKQLVVDEAKSVEEQDYNAMLQAIREQRVQADASTLDAKEVRCGGCGGSVSFTGTLTSSECPYCATPIQRENIHAMEGRIGVDGVLGFQVDKRVAEQNLRTWVKKLWFAPNDFKKRGVTGKFTGVYIPYWTFDSMTFTRYRGERGNARWVETKDSSGNTRRQRHVDWSPASGQFERFFDDVLVCAGSGLPSNLTQSLEPWPLDQCVPFSQELLAGFLARTYDLPLEDGFGAARTRIDQALHQDVRRRIGGDEQRVHNVDSHFHAITYKHLLLPCWLLSYRDGDKVYQVIVNAATGRVSGERPYSKVKIALTIFAIVVIFALIFMR